MCEFYSVPASIVLFFSLSLLVTADVYLDDECSFRNSNQKGVCTLINQCKYALNVLKSRQRPQLCDEFVDLTPVVCCPKRKCEIKCQTYRNQIQNRNRKKIIGGTKSLAKEFPHMAALGYGDKNDIQWLCGGSLISEDFVLTAAHCVNSREFGMVKWIRLGDLDLKDATDTARPENFTISKVIVHPDYKTPSHYHDIALLKLDRRAVFDSFITPACLHVEDTIPEQVIVTGWGKVDFLGKTSSHLLQATLNKIDHKTCNKTYSSVSKKKLASGIVDKLQVCAGHPEGKDTCPGDSGGPLQYKVPLNSNSFSYNVVGVTSFGKGCGYANSTGVYVRVSNYLTWIEDTVWPENTFKIAL